MPRLPSYLEELNKQLPGQPSTKSAHYHNALFRHTRFPSVSHVIWWPSKSTSTTCLVFVTGNPGLMDFYTPFLTALHEKADAKINILGRAFAGHSPEIEYPQSPSSFSLAAQVEGVVEIVDAIRSDHTKTIIVGHSVGSWVALQTLKARPNYIDSVFLLFPTICHIADTPNGHNLARLFTHPLPRIISWLSIFTRLIPQRVLATLLFPDWPSAQLQVLRAFLNSPTSVYASLSMANEEMQTITDLDVPLLETHRHIIHLYFAETDLWVGKNKDTILRAFAADQGNVRVVHGHEDIPHAFCINHGEDVAEQCYRWLRDTELV